MGLNAVGGVEHPADDPGSLTHSGESLWSSALNDANGSEDNAGIDPGESPKSPTDGSSKFKGRPDPGEPTSGYPSTADQIAKAVSEGALTPEQAMSLLEAYGPSFENSGGKTHMDQMVDMGMVSPKAAQLLRAGDTWGYARETLLPQWANPEASPADRLTSAAVDAASVIAPGVKGVAALKVAAGGILKAAGGLLKAAAGFLVKPLVSLESPRALLLRNVTDRGLFNRVVALYKYRAKIGSGSTADAIRYEKRTGLRLWSKAHTQKGVEHRNGLLKDLQSGRLNDVDKSIALQLLKDLQNALSGQ